MVKKGDKKKKKTSFRSSRNESSVIPKPPPQPALAKAEYKTSAENESKNSQYSSEHVKYPEQHPQQINLDLFHSADVKVSTESHEPDFERLDVDLPTQCSDQDTFVAPSLAGRHTCIPSV